jgi:c-di-GMP-binding flagellar brake protein YcgR
MPQLPLTISWYLLQETYFKEDDPLAATILLIGGGVLVLFFVISGLIKRAGGGGGSATPRRFSGFAMHKIASSYGLNKTQSRVLETVFRSDAVSDPHAVIESPPLLDKHFKRAYKRIERSAESEVAVQQQLSMLFSVRNTIEATNNTTATVMSSRQIADNVAAVLAVGKDTFSVHVLNAKGDGVLVENPRNALGNPIKIPKGTKVNLSFFTKNSKGFAFESRIIAVKDTPKGPALQLAHAPRVKPLIQRRFRRRQTEDPCQFALVRVEDAKVGRKKVKKMIVDSRRFKGTIMDISIGGCSVRSNTNVAAGARLKLEFELNDVASMAALGQVIRTNRGGGTYTILHVKFIKVPRRVQNSINAMVFDYAED